MTKGHRIVLLSEHDQILKHHKVFNFRCWEKERKKLPERVKKGHRIVLLSEHDQILKHHKVLNFRCLEKRSINWGLVKLLRATNRHISKHGINLTKIPERIVLFVMSSNNWTHTNLGNSVSVAYRGGVWGFKSTPPLPRNSEGPPKSCQTQPDCENC